MTELRVALLKEILSQPSAPFRERHVIDTITRELASADVPHFSDPVGNIVVGVSSRKEYLKLVQARAHEPVRIFMAHMDHPGFHGASWMSGSSDGELRVQWHGGSPTRHLEGAHVWLATRAGSLGSGTMHGVKMLASGRAIDTAVIRVPNELRASHPNAKDIYGGFGFRAPVWTEGELIYTKAADDLVGSFAIVSLAIDLFAKGRSRKKRDGAPPFLGLLTRAEEVGFIGAIGHFQLGWLLKARRQVVIVSLETSRQLPGAEIGKGPVVRLGDRATVFHPGGLQILSGIAKAVLPEKHQTRIMDGGTCEATAATVFGHDSIGISVPLGNYHNQSFEGGPDSRGELGPAPEFVDLRDVRGLLELCHGLMKPRQPWAAPWKTRLGEFKKSFREKRALLRTGP